LILRKTSKFGATRCQILRLKCSIFDFRWGSAPDPAGVAYSALTNPLAVFKGPTSKAREGEGEGRRGRVGKENGRVGEGKGGKSWLPQMGSLDPPVIQGRYSEDPIVAYRIIH